MMSRTVYFYEITVMQITHGKTLINGLVLVVFLCFVCALFDVILWIVSSVRRLSDASDMIFIVYHVKPLYTQAILYPSHVFVN